MLEWWQILILVVFAVIWVLAWTVYAIDKFDGATGLVMGPVLAVVYPVYVIGLFLLFAVAGFLLSSKGR